MSAIVEPTKTPGKGKISDATVWSTVQLLTGILKKLEFDGRWGLEFIKKEKSDEEFKFIGTDKESLQIITKPGDNTTCWECLLIPPLAYPTKTAAFSIQTNQKVPRSRLLDMMKEIDAIQKKEDERQVTSLSIHHKWNLNHNEVLERGIIAASYVLHHEKGGSRDNVVDVIGRELSLRSWIKKTKFPGKDTAAKKLRRAAEIIVGGLFEDCYLEGDVTVKLTTEGRELIDGFLDEISDKIKAKLHRGLGENPEKTALLEAKKEKEEAEKEAAEEKEAEAKRKVEAEKEAKIEAEKARIQAEKEAEEEEKAKALADEKEKERAKKDPSKLDNKGLRTKLTTLLAEHDRLLASQEEVEQEIEALETKKQFFSRSIEKSKKAVIFKDAEIEKLGEIITGLEEGIEVLVSSQESIDKEIEGYEDLRQEDAKQLEKTLKKIQKLTE